MELLNTTGMAAGYTMGMKPDGRESLVVAIKGTFTLPQEGQAARLADKQVPLITADVHTGKPGLSAPLYEIDYAPTKRRCDVLLSGSAYAPAGHPVRNVRVALRIGSLAKSFLVVGNRVWRKTLLRFYATPPEPFTVLPISYNNAFGGTDKSHADPAKHCAFLENPIGVGFHSNQTAEAMDGKPLPNTEEDGVSVSKPDGQYRPMAFGPVGRGWKPRINAAGTYDEKWLADTFPFLPSDFDDAYYQAAPPDQQIPYPHGGEEVILENLTPQGHTRFELPRIEMPVEFSLVTRQRQETHAVIDTIVIEPDLMRFTMTWRASLPLRRNIQEVQRIIVGRMSRGFYRARATGKTYYPSLKVLVQSKVRTG